jgi:hypothetical protein
MLYGAVKRNIIIDSLSLSTEISEPNRAAYYTYTYYKAAEAGFDAFIYSATNENCDIFDSDGNIRDLFSAATICGTQNYNELYAYLGKLQGAAIPNLADYVMTIRYEEENIPCEISQSIMRNKKKFAHTVCDMIPAGSVIDASAHKIKGASGEKQTHLTLVSDLSGTTAALLLCNVYGKDIIESGYVGINMYVPIASDVELVINRTEGDGSIIYIGKAEVGSVEKTYFFNISSFVDDIKASDKFSLSVRIPEYAENRESTLTVSDVALYGSSGNGRVMVITVTVAALSTLAICALLFLLTKRRKVCPFKRTFLHL